VTGRLNNYTKYFLQTLFLLDAGIDVAYISQMMKNRREIINLLTYIKHILTVFSNLSIW
jgi:hypothetical protein